MRFVGLVFFGVLCVYLTTLIALGHGHAHVPGLLLVIFVVIDILAFIAFISCLKPTKTYDHIKDERKE